MGDVAKEVTETRADTDASLDAERGTRDARDGRTAAAVEQAVGDRVEHDRADADAQLSTLRETADRSLARERLDLPPPRDSVVRERRDADDRKEAERDATDALLGRERDSADALVEATKLADEARRAPQDARRRVTNNQLSLERRTADASLAKTQSALKDSQSDDLAERRRSEKVLHETERQLRHAQKMEAVGMLAGGIAHDFNNILSVILSYGDMVLSELKPDAPMREDIEEIRKAGQRAADLTRQLLMFSRHQVIEPVVLDLNEVVVGIDKMLHRIVGADVELISLLRRPLGRIRADPGSLGQVIMNLVVNARDAMPTGGKITMETADVFLDDAFVRQHSGAKAGPHVMLSVADSGVGMDQPTVARIFEPFFTTKDKGTGLGLSAVFGIVKQSGASIHVSSEEGKGTTFAVYFPRVEAPTVSTRPPALARSHRGSETILLVEDDEPVRVVAASILRKNGYVVVEARNAGEAMMQSDGFGGEIHLLLSDVIMPLLSGPELAKRPAKTRPKMKVLCMSGHTDDSIVRHGVIEAHFEYLQKPLTPDGLAAKVRSVLDAER
jgi:two-component system, cell cycle sensor histidine kinase and response regulator CckA